MVGAIIGIGVFIGIIGLVLTENNAKYLLAGYNMWSKDDRAKFDIKAYVAYFRKFHLFLGATIIGFGLLTYYFIDENWAGYILTVYPILAYIYFLLMSRKFYTIQENSSAKIGVYVLIAVLIITVLLGYYGLRESYMVLEENNIKIEGVYGTEWEVEEIVAVKIVNQLPEIRAKSNGFSLGSIRKGYFKTKDFEKVKLIINENKGPYLEITSKKDPRTFYSSSKMSERELLHAISENFPEILVEL